jgi:hypothetical protein
MDEKTESRTPGSNGARLHAPNKTDHDTAMSLKEKFAVALDPILALCNEANSAGLDVQLAFARDKFGALTITPILIKTY